MKMNRFMYLAIVAAVLCGGCFFPRGVPAKSVNYLPGLPEKCEPVLSLRPGAVSNISGAGKEFLLRGEADTVKVVPEMRWLNSPESMLKSVMLMNFAGDHRAPAVSAQIVRFEFTPDFRELEAVIIFSIKSEKNIVCMETVPVKDKNYGEAASQLFKRAINKVSTAVKK